MNLFFDTSVLVAAMVQSHPHHAAAIVALSQVVSGKARGSICCHSLAELYAVLTRLPLSPAIQPAEAHRLIEENVLAHFELFPLMVDDYQESLRALAVSGRAGALIYDALLLRAAARSGADQVLTFNVGHFQRLAHTPELHARISAPTAPRANS